MVECMRAMANLNLSKIQLNTTKFPSPNLSFPSSESRPKSKNYPKFSLSALLSQSQQQPSFDGLVSSSRKHDVLDAIKGSLSSCLSETNLHLTVPGLKSKTRGKVLVFFLLISCLVMKAKVGYSAEIKKKQTLA